MPWLFEGLLLYEINIGPNINTVRIKRNRNSLWELVSITDPRLAWQSPVRPADPARIRNAENYWRVEPVVPLPFEDPIDPVVDTSE